MPKQSDAIKVFEKSTFLAGLTRAQLAELAATLSSIEVKSGDAVFYAGEPGDKAYFVRAGEVELATFDHAGEKLVYALATPPNMFGELAVLDGKPRTATAIALKDTKLDVLERTALASFLERNPDAALSLLSMLASRVRQANENSRGRIAKNPNAEYERGITFLERISARLGDFTGTTTFLVVNFVLMTIWCLANLFDISFLPQYDPPSEQFPWLQFYAGSIGGFFVMLLVMISQNVQAEKDKIRNDIQYQVNLKSELQIGQLRERLEELHRILNTRLDEQGSPNREV